MTSEATIISEKGSHIPSTKLPADYGVGYSAEQISRAVAVPQYNRGPITLYNLLEGLQVSLINSVVWPALLPHDRFQVR